MLSSNMFIPILASLSLVSAKSSLFTRDLTPEVAASNATIYSGDHGYTYQGCYNETTGIANSAMTRALADGNMTSYSNTTAQDCISYCRANDMKYAGLEYGQECWCAAYISGLSAQLNESSCNLACVGNTSEICGGSLTLTLYEQTGGSARVFGGSWVYAVGAGMLGSVALIAL